MTIEKIKSTIDAAQEILVATHIGPDGDALGSLTAIGQALKHLKKDVTLACDDGMLRKFEYLPLSDQIERRPELRKQYDLLIALDCGDSDRMGRVYERLTYKPPILNIDHHISNTYFGEVNVVEAEKTSTTEILTHIIPALGVPLDAGIATSLLTGMVTDTLGFRVTGVTAETLQVAGTLVEAGADLADIMLKALVLQELNTIKMWSIGLSNMHIENSISWSVLSLSDQRKVSNDSVSNHGLGNMIADIDTVSLSIVFTEKEDGSVKVGFRSRPPWDVATIAVKLGGGGHRYASGCTRYGKLENVVAEVLALSQDSLKQQRKALAAEENSVAHQA
ncbi:MAG: bifunctional oligoribonuclease/PAP phosphatase NrnA [Chloroflexota bacterium]